MAWTKEHVESVLAEIMRRSQQDPDFRQLSLRDPVAAVKAVSSQELPPNFKLRFVDNDRADLTVVLPDALPPGQGQELSDDALSAVSGGIIPTTTLSPTYTVYPTYSTSPTYTTPLTSGSCFAAGTPVLMADGTWRPIETIGVGAEVLAFDERAGTVVTAKVSQRLDHAPESIYRAVLAHADRDLLVTPNHPFYSRGRWRAIGDLLLESELYHFDAKRDQSAPRRLHAFEPSGRREPVFNLEVEDAHTYFVDGVLVHNGGAGPKLK